ncbi:MAG: chemotaxis protein CheW [Porticoccaceae bacterium]
MNESAARNATGNNATAMLTKAGEDQFLTFLLGGEEYGVDILRVQEIRGWDGATAIPNTPDYVLGVINLRGIVVPIVDLRKRFKLSEANFDAATVVVVVNVIYEGSERVMGAVVDGVSDVYNFSADDISDAPDLGIKISTEVVKGFAMADDKMIIILDIDKLITLGLLDNVEISSAGFIEELSGEPDNTEK